MNSLSHQLISWNYGFVINNNGQQSLTNHLWYMNDLELLSSTKNTLEQNLTVVEEFSNDLGILKERPCMYGIPMKSFRIMSNYKLISGKVFSETEGILPAIKDQVIPTRNYRYYYDRL